MSKSSNNYKNRQAEICGLKFYATFGFLFYTSDKTYLLTLLKYQAAQNIFCHLGENLMISSFNRILHSKACNYEKIFTLFTSRLLIPLIHFLVCTSAGTI